MSHDELNILRPCSHLRSKGMYVTGLTDPAEDGHGDGNCWCSQTQHVYGPDDQFVDRQQCHSGRPCYQSVL